MEEIQVKGLISYFINFPGISAVSLNNIKQRLKTLREEFKDVKRVNNKQNKKLVEYITTYLDLGEYLISNRKHDKHLNKVVFKLRKVQVFIAGMKSTSEENSIRLRSLTLFALYSLINGRQPNITALRQTAVKFSAKKHQISFLICSRFFMLIILLCLWTKDITQFYNFSNVYRSYILSKLKVKRSSNQDKINLMMVVFSKQEGYSSSMKSYLQYSFSMSVLFESISNFMQSSGPSKQMKKIIINTTNHIRLVDQQTAQFLDSLFKLDRITLSSSRRFKNSERSSINDEIFNSQIEGTYNTKDSEIGYKDGGMISDGRKDTITDMVDTYRITVKGSDGHKKRRMSVQTKVESKEKQFKKKNGFTNRKKIKKNRFLFFNTSDQKIKKSISKFKKKLDNSSIMIRHQKKKSLDLGQDSYRGFMSTRRSTTTNANQGKQSSFDYRLGSIQTMTQATQRTYKKKRGAYLPIEMSERTFTNGNSKWLSKADLKNIKERILGQKSQKKNQKLPKKKTRKDMDTGLGLGGSISSSKYQRDLIDMKFEESDSSESVTGEVHPEGLQSPNQGTSLRKMLKRSKSGPSETPKARLDQKEINTRMRMAIRRHSNVSEEVQSNKSLMKISSQRSATFGDIVSPPQNRRKNMKYKKKKMKSFRTKISQDYIKLLNERPQEQTPIEDDIKMLKLDLDLYDKEDYGITEEDDDNLDNRRPTPEPITVTESRISFQKLSRTGRRISAVSSQTPSSQNHMRYTKKRTDDLREVEAPGSTSNTPSRTSKSRSKKSRSSNS